VGEAEGQLPERFKTDQLFPKYIVIREVEIWNIYNILN
jgi:hypothetical protein